GHCSSTVWPTARFRTESASDAVILPDSFTSHTQSAQLALLTAARRIAKASLAVMSSEGTPSAVASAASSLALPTNATGSPHSPSPGSVVEEEVVEEDVVVVGKDVVVTMVVVVVGGVITNDVPGAFVRPKKSKV